MALPVDAEVRGREDAIDLAERPTVAMVWSRFRPSAMRSSTVDCGTPPPRTDGDYSEVVCKVPVLSLFRNACLGWV